MGYKKNRKGKIFSRSKRVYKTSRSAWENIGHKTGLRPHQVKSMHTRTHWRWTKK